MNDLKAPWSPVASLTDADRAFLLAMAAWGAPPQPENGPAGLASDFRARLRRRLAPAGFPSVCDALLHDSSLAIFREPQKARERLTRMHVAYGARRACAGSPQLVGSCPPGRVAGRSATGGRGGACIFARAAAKRALARSRRPSQRARGLSRGRQLGARTLDRAAGGGRGRAVR